MPLFQAHYYVRWVATSHDSRGDQLHKVVISSPSWEQARTTIVEHEENQHQFCRVEFVTLTRLEDILWK